MSIHRMIVIAAAFFVASGALYSPAYADGYGDHSDFGMHHCRDYGGVMTANGCYISSKKQRKRLIYDEMAWDNAHPHHEHHRYHEDYGRNY